MHIKLIRHQKIVFSVNKLQTAQLSFGGHITSIELHRETTNELPIGKENFDDHNQFHCTILLTVSYLKHCFFYKINNFNRLRQDLIKHRCHFLEVMFCL
jgi:hypothetical protein